MHSTLITFVLVGFKQDRFIRKAIEGAFAQSYVPLEIILSDDCSPDRTFDIMQEMAAAYKGPHQVVLHRNPSNIGIVAHFNNVVEIARGEIIIRADGDDISLPNRTEKCWKIFSEHPDAACVELNTIPMNVNGGPILSGSKDNQPGLTRHGLASVLSTKQVLHYCGAARAFRKEAFMSFGPMRASCSADDSPMLIRFLIRGAAYVSNANGIYYRIHDGNSSGPQNSSRISLPRLYRQYLTDIRVAMKRGYATQSLLQEYKGHCRVMISRRIIEGRIGQSKSKLLFIIGPIFFSNAYSFKEKMGFLRRELQSRLRNVAGKLLSRRSVNAAK
jgi:glycosyltransferase involved in cell wall biosynthesis